MNTPRFLTATEASRAGGFTVSSLLRAVADGKVTPAGRAGHSKNSAVLFLAGDVPALAAVVLGGATAGAGAGARHLCQSLADIEAKASAFRRAAIEEVQA